MLDSTTARALLAAVVFVTGGGCGSVAAIRAVRRGESAVAVSMGGPVARIMGADIPFPYAVARYRYGLTDRAGLHAGGHLTAAGLGLVGIDAGLSYQFLDQHGWVPALSTNAGLTAFVKPGRDEALFPQLDLAASYLFGDRLLGYFGSQSMYQLNDRPYIVLAPFVGGDVRLSRGFSLNLEAKWYAPTEPTKPRNVDYRIPVAGRGAVGFVLGLNYQFGGWYD